MANDSDDPIPKDKKALLQALAQEIIGRDTRFRSPYGDRALCYADFTASGRSLRSIEQYVQQQVLPLYGNTHTTTSVTGLQFTCFRDEARAIIAQAVNAKISGRGAADCVVFTGSGATSAVNKLVTILGLHVPLASEQKALKSLRPVVFVGPFEHHSNLLPWRESSADVVRIPENDKGLVDLVVLRKRLKQFADRPLKIGSFSAASNLTGVLTDTNSVSALLHQHGALAFWDYASCAPYVAIDMNPSVNDPWLRPFVYKDAVFFSGHKFLGGPGSPGVLVVKKRLVSNDVPSMPGGGTVVIVTDREHHYVSNREEREEGGTPDIIGSIRLGLAFEVKQRVGHKAIMQLEHAHVKRVREALGCNEKIVLLGRDGLDQLPIFSFLIRFGDRFLHYNFVCALLNDLFGVQSRGGCQCAGPYAFRLLGVSKSDVAALQEVLISGLNLLRPGFSRVSFPYYVPTADVDYVVKAIEFVANDGWKFLPQYQIDHSRGTWTHKSRVTGLPNPNSLLDFQIGANGASSNPSASATSPSLSEIVAHRRENFKEAAQLAADSMNSSSCAVKPATNPFGGSKESLRWFVYPFEVMGCIKSGQAPPIDAEIRGPIQPKWYAPNQNLHSNQSEAKTKQSNSQSSVQVTDWNSRASIGFRAVWQKAISHRSEVEKRQMRSPTSPVPSECSSN